LHLPLTGTRVVDMVVTDLGVFSIDKHGGSGITLVEAAPGVFDRRNRARTEAEFKVS